MSFVVVLGAVTATRRSRPLASIAKEGAPLQVTVLREGTGTGDVGGEQLGRTRAPAVVGWGEMEEMEEVGSWELSGRTSWQGPMQRSVLCALLGCLPTSHWPLKARNDDS